MLEGEVFGGGEDLAFRDSDRVVSVESLDCFLIDYFGASPHLGGKVLGVDSHASVICNGDFDAVESIAGPAAAALHFG